MIMRIKQQPGISARALVEDFGLNILERTNRRRAVEAGLFFRRPAKKPEISKKNREGSSVFC